MFLMKLLQLPTLLNLDPWVHGFVTFCEEMKIPIKHFCCTSSTMVVLRKNVCTFELPIFTHTPFTWQMTDRKCSYTDLGIWQIFFQEVDNETVISRKTTDTIFANDKMRAFKQVLEFKATCIHHWTWQLLNIPWLFWWDWTCANKWSFFHIV